MSALYETSRQLWISVNKVSIQSVSSYLYLTITIDLINIFKHFYYYKFVLSIQNEYHKNKISVFIVDTELKF